MFTYLGSSPSTFAEGMQFFLALNHRTLWQRFLSLSSRKKLLFPPSPGEVGSQPCLSPAPLMSSKRRMLCMVSKFCGDTVLLLLQAALTKAPLQINTDAFYI